MKFSATDQAAMLAATGSSILIGATAKTGKFNEAGKVFDSYTGGIVTTSPTLLLSEADAALVTPSSTVITIGSKTYQALDIMPDGAGFCELNLTEDY